jgi:hypothetical protein
LIPTHFKISDTTLFHNFPSPCHAVTTYGYIYLLDEHADGLDDYGATASLQRAPVRGRILTRGITHGTIEPKRFNHLQIETDLDAGDTFTVANITRNPDHRHDLLTFTAPRATDCTHRLHLRARGVVAQVEFTTTTGRPALRGVLLEAATANNQDRATP